MPRRRLGLLLRIACLIVLIVTAAAWVISYSTWHKVSLGRGRLIEPPPQTGAEPGWWTFRLTTTFAMSQRGVLFLGIDHYDSLAPTADELRAQWTDMLGWAHDSFETDSRTTRPWFSWQPWDSVLFLDLGTLAGARQGIESRVILIPYWFITLLCAIPWLTHFRRARRYRTRLATGRCTKCGYDRRGLATGAVCPECGHALATSSPA